MFQTSTSRGLDSNFEGKSSVAQGKAISEISLLALPIRPQGESANLKRIHTFNYPPYKDSSNQARVEFLPSICHIFILKVLASFCQISRHGSVICPSLMC